MNQELGKKLLSILKEEQVKKDEPMKSHTTFRVGGPADYFVTPQTAEEVAKVIEACTQEKVPYYIVGNGRCTDPCTGWCAAFDDRKESVGCRTYRI